MHHLAYACGRIVPVALTRLTMADISMAVPLLEAMAPTQRLLADKAYDADRLRTGSLRDTSRPSHRAAQPETPPIPQLHAYQGRNVIKRMFGKLKNWKRIATHYDSSPYTSSQLSHLSLLRRSGLNESSRANPESAITEPNRGHPRERSRRSRRPGPRSCGRENE